MIEFLLVACTMQPCYYSEEANILQVPASFIERYGNPLEELSTEYGGTKIIFVENALEL